MDPQETRIFTAVLIAVIIIGIIIGFFVFSVIKQQRRNLALQKANIRAEISAMERERARIAADLHDDIGPILSVIKFQVDNIDSVNEDDSAQLKEASTHLDGMIARMREISNNLMPSALQRKGLVTAIDEFRNRVNATERIRISFQYDEFPEPSQEKSIHMYRVVQELIHNCLKHSEASDAELELRLRSKNYCIQFRDNGKGFDYASTSSLSEGIGLKSLRNRTELMDGKMEVSSTSGKGAFFSFEIPVI